MDKKWCYTVFVNDTDTEIRIEYGDYPHTLNPKSAVFVHWRTYDQRETRPPQFRLEGVKLDRNIFVHDLYRNRGITIYKQRAGYSFQTFQGKYTNVKFPSIPLSFSELRSAWVSESRWTTFVNKTDMMIKIEYDGDVYTFQPMSADNVRWFTYDARETLLPQLLLKGVILDHNISVHDLYGNREITIFRGVENTYSFQTLSDDGFKESLKKTVSSIKTFLLGMEELLKKVSIWRNQCEHLFKKYSISVNIIVGVLNALIMAKEEPLLRPLTTSSIKFTCSKFICCMLEGEALLLLCGKSGYNKAAFALSSPPPSVPTFSRFALVLRELHLTLNYIYFIQQNHVQGIYSSFDVWEWCEESCKPNFLGGYFGANFGDMEDESLKADDHRQIADREALLKSLNEPKFMWKRFTRNEFDAELEAIWRKRLESPSQAPEPDSDQPCSILNCFWIDKVEYECIGPLGGGSYKQVVKAKWLGELVAVAIIPNYIPKEKLEAEAGLLARVQHPNVVQLMGYAYEEDALDNNDLDNDDLNNSGKRFLLTEVMQQDLESLINDKCRQQQRRISQVGSGTSSILRAPFDLPVAIDMASQIVEAMIHMKKCGLIHRDLKPSNCLASPKYRKNSFPDSSDIPVYYTIKVTDFDTAKMRGENSYFHSERKGTACYMAPELYGMPEEKWPYTWSADVWSFGMTCYQIFTGRAPFMTNKLKDVSTLIREGERPLFPFECRDDLKRLIEKCWARNPDDRPTFEDIRKDLWRLKLYACSSFT